VISYRNLEGLGRLQYLEYFGNRSSYRVFGLQNPKVGNFIKRNTFPVCAWKRWNGSKLIVLAENMQYLWNGTRWTNIALDH